MTEETRDAAYWRRRAEEAEGLIEDMEDSGTVNDQIIESAPTAKREPRQPASRPTPPPRPPKPSAPSTPDIAGALGNVLKFDPEKVKGIIGTASKLLSGMAEQRRHARSRDGLVELLTRLSIPFTETENEIVIKKADLGGA